MWDKMGRISNNGMGGFLCPPSHPEHSMSVSFVDGRMSLSSAITCEWLNPATRYDAKKILDKWEKPDINNPEIKKWIRQVLGYFANCYKGDGKEPECWNVSNLKMLKKGQRKPAVDNHAGVRLIRKYYPEYVPSKKDFREAKWGN
jgi:hypothetical protein